MIKKVENAILKIVIWITMVVFLFLSMINIMGTTYIDTNRNGFKEYASYQLDNYLLSVILVGLFFGFIYFVDKYIGIEKISTDKIRIASIIYAIAMGVIWILMLRAYPVEDQSIVQRNAANFINGDYSALQKGEYLYIYPHQLGIVFIFECLYRIFGTENYQVIMFLNVFLTAGILDLLFKIMKKMTDSKKAHNFFWMMSFGCFPLIFYSYFVYGTTIGLFFALCGIYFLMKFYNSGKYWDFIVAFVSSSLAIIAKSNYRIFVIAAILVAVFSVIQDKKYKYLLPVLVLVFTFMTPNLIQNYYEQRSGMELGSGSPAVLHIAMGLQEGNLENGCGAAGWYNAYNIITYKSADCDSEAASEIARQNISERMSEFAQSPLKALDFVFEKTATQWAEPTFETFWMTQAKDNHYEESELMESIGKGKINTILLQIMKIYLMLMFVGNFIYLIANWNRINMWQLILSVVVIGGFIFHLFWEGKSQYIMPYFVVSIVAGAQGILEGYEWLKTQCRNIGEKKHEK